MERKPITVECVLATRPPNYPGYGLITLKIDTPLFIWTELLTHRRFSRNASSARAMSSKRYSDMGYYIPDTWYTQGTGMQAGEPAQPSETTEMVAQLFADNFEMLSRIAQAMQDKGFAKEQVNRLIPPYKMVRGIVTGTESAWQYFLTLRDSPEADTAMQDLARKVRKVIDWVKWQESDTHIPFGPDIAPAVASIARVSYAREKGKNDQELYNSLKDSGHWSCFEHIARWELNPALSNFSCTLDDVYVLDPKPFPKCDYWGWGQYRHDLITTEG